MNDTVIQKTLKEHGLIKNIPESVLQEKGLKIIHDPTTNTYQLTMLDSWQEQVNSCHSVLRKYEGYIFAHHLSRLYRVINGHETITDEDLLRIGGIAKKLKESGIPPIFHQHHQTPFEYLDSNMRRRVSNLYPYVDFIIQFTTGAYFQRAAATAAKLTSQLKNRPQKLTIPMQPTIPEDVFEFCRLAFTSDKQINELLITDILAYKTTHFKSPPEKLETDRKTIYWLEAQLRPLVPDKPEPTTWNGEHIVAEQHCWYLSFSPEDCIKIAQSYINHLETEPTGVSTTRTAFSRINALFPALVNEWRNEKEVTKTDKELQEFLSALEEDYREENLPPLANTFFKQEMILNKIKAGVHRVLHKLREANPENLLTTTSCIPINYNCRLFKNQALREILLQHQLHVLQTISDEQFRQLFPTKKDPCGRVARYKSFITSIQEVKIALAQQLMSLLKKRYDKTRAPQQ